MIQKVAGAFGNCDNVWVLSSIWVSVHMTVLFLNFVFDDEEVSHEPLSLLWEQTLMTVLFLIFNSDKREVNHEPLSSLWEQTLMTVLFLIFNSDKGERLITNLFYYFENNLLEHIHHSS